MKMDIYEPFQQVSMWGGNFKVDGGLNSIASPMLMVDSTSVENKVRKCDFYFFCWVNFFFMWNLDYKSYNSIFWIWILQSEDIPQESREPSGSGADQETTNKDVNKVLKFLQDIPLLCIAIEMFSYLLFHCKLLLVLRSLKCDLLSATLKIFLKHEWFCCSIFVCVADSMAAKYSCVDAKTPSSESRGCSEK